MPLARITITVPAAVIRQADRVARREGRSRSWVIADALRRQFADAGAEAARVPAPSESAPDLVEASARVRTAHVGGELSLTPAERLARAEELGGIARERQGRGRREQVIAFDSYDDFYRWKAARLIGA
jgi:hypothetical protein